MFNSIAQTAVNYTLETEIWRIDRKRVRLPARQDEMQRAGVAEKALHIAEAAAQQPVRLFHLKGAGALRAVLFYAKGHGTLLCTCWYLFAALVTEFCTR